MPRRFARHVRNVFSHPNGRWSVLITTTLNCCEVMGTIFETLFFSSGSQKCASKHNSSTAEGKGVLLDLDPHGACIHRLPRGSSKLHVRKLGLSPKRFSNSEQTILHSRNPNSSLNETGDSDLRLLGITRYRCVQRRCQTNVCFSPKATVNPKVPSVATCHQ